MEPDPPSPSPRKVRFAPKGPPRRSPRLAIEEEDKIEDSELQQVLARRVAEHLARKGRSVEKKSPVQVAFSHGSASTPIRSFGRLRKKYDDASERINDGNTTAYSEESGTGEMQQAVGDSLVDLTDAPVVKKKKEYREPWDYHHSYYPTTLPLRRPYSGDPGISQVNYVEVGPEYFSRALSDVHEVLDKAEFEDDAPEYDESTISPASDLGFLEKDDTPRMLFFMFPPNLPLARLPNNLNKNEKGKEKVMVGSVPKSPGISNGIGKGLSLQELPDGYMGKMVVYKSGAVKLKLGDIIYDVSPGTQSSCPQKVMAINVTDKHCCEIGEVSKTAVVTPDIDSLLNSETD